MTVMGIIVNGDYRQWGLSSMGIIVMGIIVVDTTK
jgi:hypothetical protein